MSKEVAYLFSTGKAMELQLINNFATAAFCALKDLAPFQMTIAIWSSSGLNRFPTLAIGTASD